jgi:hypothetical protein
MTARAKQPATARTTKPTAARSAKPTGVPRPPRKKRVTLVAPITHAAEVIATGDFSGWSAEGVRLKRRRDGSWSATLQLSPGSYEYRLLVDGQWWNNPACEHRSGNPYGSENDLLIVT